MLGLLVFDVDGTLAPIEEAVSRAVSNRIARWEEEGLLISLASGKEMRYISALSRGIGLRNPLIIAENGCIIYNPLGKGKQKLIEARPRAISLLESELRSAYGDRLWFQPNEIQLTAFPKGDVSPSEVASFLRGIISRQKLSDEVILFQHRDSVDALPWGIDKGKALSELIKDLGIGRDSVVSVGDRVNDVPMFEESGFSILVGGMVGISDKASISLESIDEALEKIQEMLDLGG